MRSAESTNAPTTLTLSNISAGTYHLTGGTIYEKANEWSPGHDFGNGTVTEACFGTLPDITVTVGGSASDEYLGVKTEARVYEDFQNDIWLQYQQKDMQVGDTTNLRPWRVEQIVSDVINNDVARPNFHFEIIAGDSISLDTTESKEKAVVTAKKAGTSIVKVTYDALEYKGKIWGAISPVNTAYAIFTVGETGTAIITTNEDLAKWRHYHAFGFLYYEGNCTGESDLPDFNHQKQWNKCVQLIPSVDTNKVSLIMELLNEGECQYYKEPAVSKNMFQSHTVDWKQIIGYVQFQLDSPEGEVLLELL